jgi:Rrf2 family protein
MKISARGRYGIRFLIDLAEHGRGEHITLARAAKRQGISLRYLEQVAVILRRAGLIHSVKGSSGGYALAKSPEEINVGEALRALEGDMLVADPPLPGARETQLQRCVRRMVYDRLNAQIAKIIDNKTLASLAGTTDSAGYMYFI